MRAAARRRVYGGWRESLASWRPLVAAAALGALIVPLAMHWVEIAFASDAAASGWLRSTRGMGSVWEAAGANGWMVGAWNVPWWLTAWGLALAFPLAVALLGLLFEGLVRALQLDRERHSASALHWSLSAWRVALVAYAATAVVPWVIGPRSGQPGWTFLLPFVLPIVATVALQFFAWSPAYVAAPRPAAPSRFRWPGILPVLLFVASWFLPWLLFATVIGLWPGELPTWLGIALFAISFPLSVYVGLCVELFWFNAASIGAGPALRDAARESSRWRAFGGMLALSLRSYALLVAVLLPLLPACVFLIAIFPSLETVLAAGPVPASIRPMIDASRAVVAWWWLAGTLAWALLQGALLAWVMPLASGRLLHQLGLIAPTEAPGMLEGAAAPPEAV
jgi:hypothetical protein